MAVIPMAPFPTWLQKHSRTARVLLLGAAALLVLVGWLAPLVLRSDPWLTANAANIRSAAAAPALLWGLYEALLSRSTHGGAVQAREVDKRIELILLELEEKACELKIGCPTYRCGVAVWRLGKLSRRDRKVGEGRRPLEPAALRELRYRRRTSGLHWREGMGVMGVAVAENQALGINLHERWAPLLNASQTEWDNAEKYTRLGLTYAEFRQTVSRTGDAGPFILAVPYYKSGEARGVAVLDAPPTIGPAVINSRVDLLLWSLAGYVLGDPAPVT